jgi:multidrug efflux system outer membrane protein
MSYELPLNMSYEVDLWKKIQGRFDAATKHAESEAERLRGTILTVTSDLASHYFNAHLADTQIELLQRIVDLYQKTEMLRDLRYRLGLDSLLDVLKAKEDVAEAEAVLEDAQRQRRYFENAVGALIGDTASAFRLMPKTLASLPPAIPAGIPSLLLIRRPDIAQAEKEMAAAYFLIGPAYAAFFPSLHLTGALGFLSPELSEFLTWKGHLWKWGANLFETIFDGFRNQSKLDMAKENLKRVEGIYRSTVITAFKEVENALNNVARQTEEFQDLTKSLDASERVVSLYERRFEEGLSNQLDVLKEKLEKIETECFQIQILGRLYQSTVQIIKALGGGWGLPSKENDGQTQSKTGNQDHRPEIVQDDGEGEFFQEESSCNG